MIRIAEKAVSMSELFRTALVLVVISLASPAWAATLEEARSQGLIGERPDGLVGAISLNVSSEVAALVSEVNTARLGSYRRLAGQDNAPLQAIQAIAGEKLIEKGRQNGWYVMDSSGIWQR